MTGPQGSSVTVPSASGAVHVVDREDAVQTQLLESELDELAHKQMSRLQNFIRRRVSNPADIEDPTRRRQAFRDTVTYLGRRIDLMLALPFESLERRAAEERLRRIGLATPETSDTPSRE